MTRQTLNTLVNERAGISPDMAIRLEKAFGGSADMWLFDQQGLKAIDVVAPYRMRTPPPYEIPLMPVYGSAARV